MYSYDDNYDFGAPTNLSDVDENAFETFPAGTYTVELTDIDIKPNSAGTGELVRAVFRVTEGQYRDRKIFENYNVRNPNPTAVRIALAKIKQLVMACGYTGNEQLTVGLLRSCIGREFTADVIIEQQDGYPDKNVVKKYHRRQVANETPWATQGQSQQQAQPPAPSTAMPPQPAPAPDPVPTHQQPPWATQSATPAQPAPSAQPTAQSAAQPPWQAQQPAPAPSPQSGHHAAPRPWER